jgi:hypothetical protein
MLLNASIADYCKNAVFLLDSGTLSITVRKLDY